MRTRRSDIYLLVGRLQKLQFKRGMRISELDSPHSPGDGWTRYRLCWENGSYVEGRNLRAREMEIALRLAISILEEGR